MRAEHSPLECSLLLGMDKSSVTREMARNSCSDGVYRGYKAHKSYLERRKRAKGVSRKIENNQELESHIRKCLKKKDSPEQISGRLKRVGSLHSVSDETIYRWVFNEEPELKKYLRYISKKGKYRRRRGTKKREYTRELAKIRRIEERPKIVDKRERLGDWEGDTIVGLDKTKRLLSNVDRYSGYGLLDKLDVVTAENTQEKLKERFTSIPQKKRHTYTYDNGSEIGRTDRDLEKKIGMEVFRATPYHSWERGSNENYNGLVRDFFPKGTDFATIGEKEVKRVEKNLNHRPRKRLGYLTPHEVFVLEMKPLTGAVQIWM